MKISKAHYETMKAAVDQVILAAPKAEESYRSHGLSPMRFRWDCLRSAVIDGKPGIQWLCDTLYPAGLNDDHIDTALRRILEHTR
jgi:hypothetical protein